MSKAATTPMKGLGSIKASLEAYVSHIPDIASEK